MRARGFTLVEVLVALVIVAAGAAAVLSSLNSAAMSTVYLRDKTFAGWIADNRIAETRLQTTPAQNGTTEGEVEYAGQRWQWRQQIVDAAVPGLRRIDVSVRPALPGAPRQTSGTTTTVADNAPVEDWTLTLSAVIGRDLARPGSDVIDWEPVNPGGGGAGRTSSGDGTAGANGAAGGSSPGGNAGGDGQGDAAGDGAGGTTPTRPPGGPRFGEGPRT